MTNPISRTGPSRGGAPGVVRWLGGAAVSCMLGTAAVGCDEARAAAPEPAVSRSAQALDIDDVKEVAKECGLVCPGDTDKAGVRVQGIADGNAAISGVGSVDAFFASVLHFQQASASVASGIDEQLAAIRGDFGLAAGADIVSEVKVQIAANVQDNTVVVEHEPARCSLDVKAALDAQARCDAQFDPGQAMVACKGDCEVSASASASCDAQADLECTFNAPSITCEGSCRGSCEAQLSAAASCEGTCRGSCDGTCSAYVMDASGKAQCAGRCSGMCSGSCETQLAAGASCSGKCSGECVVMNPSGGCSGGIRASCKAHANAMVMCGGRCDADFEPPKAKAECEASVKADAKCHMHCTPPRTVVHYRQRSDAEIAARGRFDAAMKMLAEVRLPALLAEQQHGSLVLQAGSDLNTAAQGAVKGSVNEALSGKLSVQESFGLACAVNELPKVDAIVSASNKQLNQSLSAATAVTAMLGG